MLRIATAGWWASWLVSRTALDWLGTALSPVWLVLTLGGFLFLGGALLEAWADGTLWRPDR